MVLTAPERPPLPPTKPLNHAKWESTKTTESYRPHFAGPVISWPKPTAPVSMGEPPPPDLPSVGAGETDAISERPTDPPTPPAAKTPTAVKRVRMTSMEASQLIRKVQPVYPALARQVRVQGEVMFTAVISKSGTIEDLQLVRGHPLLVIAAREAILQWRYKPTMLNGEPVEVITNIQVNFTLSGQ